MDGVTFREVHHVEIRKTDPKQTPDVSFVVEGPVSVLSLLREILQGKEQESFVILILDGANKVSAWREVARGAADQVSVPTREMFRTALLCDARALVLAHNHPSGNPTPSEADLETTARLRLAGEMINIPILDHIIIGEGERFHSFALNGGSGDALPMNAPRQGPELD